MYFCTCESVDVLIHSNDSLLVQTQHVPRLQHPERKHFQMLPSCCRTARGNARQAKRKSSRDGGDPLEDRGCSK